MADYIERAAVEHMLKAAQVVSDAEGIYCGYFTEDVRLSEIPSVDVAPVVHGHWIESKEHIYLADSVCKEWINFYCSECDAPNNSPTDFCPNCGAKMEEEGRLVVLPKEKNEI